MVSKGTEAYSKKNKVKFFHLVSGRDDTRKLLRRDIYISVSIHISIQFSELHQILCSNTKPLIDTSISTLFHVIRKATF